MDIIRSAGVEPFLFDVSMWQEVDAAFFKADIIVITIPFKRSFENPVDYCHQMEQILALADKASVQHIIFTSSTSIYGQYRGGVVSEKDYYFEYDPRLKVLQDIEQMLLASNCASTIVRLAGLYGGERKIGSFLKGPSSIDKPESPVNLVHLADCVEVIVQIIQQNVWQEIFNVVSDKHPTRREIYTRVAERRGLPIPRFRNDGIVTKIVSNEKVKKQLGYSFIHSDPMKDI